MAETDFASDRLRAKGWLVRTTVKEIARHCGVSPARVSLVLRKSPLVAETRRARIVFSMDALGYVYHRAAANLRARLCHTIGMIVCEITNPFYAELTAGVDEALDKAGWIAFLANAEESPAPQDRFIARLREQRVDGVIVAPAEGTTPEASARWRRQELPVVQILRRIGPDPCDHVSADFRLGVKLAVEHLVTLGHRRIAFIGGARQVSTARDRADAFHALLSRYGASPGPIVSCLPTREDGARAASKLFAGRRSDPTAVICHNNLCAIGLMLGLVERRLNPGRDVAVIGFDDIPESALQRPALTSVGIGARRIWRVAAELLLRRIGAPKGEPETIIRPPRLIKRRSCGAKPIN